MPKEFEGRDRTRLGAELLALEKSLGLGRTLARLKIREAGGFDKPEGSGYFLLKLAREGEDCAGVSCMPFKPEEAALALDEYQSLEQTLPQDDSVNAVLIRVQQASLIKTAYPNYYWDASSFMARLEAIRDEA